MGKKISSSEKHNRTENKLLPFETIVSAAKGDCEAIEDVLEHFKYYIQALSVREYKDEYGNGHAYIDEVLRKRLELKMITRILKFKPKPMKKP